MVRTQVYLTDQQIEGLKRLAATSGRKQSELIRDALDAYIAANRPTDWREAFRAVQGMWVDRDDLDELRGQLRDEVEERLDRRFRSER